MFASSIDAAREWAKAGGNVGSVAFGATMPAIVVDVETMLKCPIDCPHCGMTMQAIGNRVNITTKSRRTVYYCPLCRERILRRAIRRWLHE